MARSKKRSKKFNSSANVIDLKDARSKRHQKAEAKANKKKFKLKARERKPRSKKIKIEKKELSPRKRKQRNRRLLLGAIITVVCVLVLGSSVFKIADLLGEQRKLEAEKIQLTKEKAELIKEVKSKDNKNYIEQQARKQLHLIMPGEILYVLPDEGEED